MSGFKRIDDSVIIYRRGPGVFYQTQAYEHSSFIYAKVGSGYIKICGDGRTSVANITIVHSDIADVSVESDSLGYLHATQ